jgi:flagellar protein FlbT
MSKPIQINLRPKERIYINGAVVRVDRRVTIELMNDVTFLLESHVLQPEQTTTTLRQLYFVVQSMLMDPVNAPRALEVFEEMHRATLASFTNDTVITGLCAAGGFVGAGRIFDALRTLRTLFPIEDEILAQPPRAA